MDKVRLGMIGCGFMGQAVHLPSFVANKNCQVTALSDMNEDLCRRVAEKFGIPKRYAKAEDLLADNELDAVALIVPPQRIADLAVKALENGKHVLAEKPIALRNDEGKRMADASRKSNKLLVAGYMKRYDLGTGFVKKFLADPSQRAGLGKITYARFHNFNGAFRGQLEPEYIRDKNARGYPELGDLRIPDFVKAEDRDRYFCSFTNFCHDINLMRYLLGDPRTVYASHHRAGPSDYHTFSVSIFEYDGYTAALETGCIECEDFDETAQIYFERGWIELKFPQVLLQSVPARVTVFDNATGIMTPALGWGWNFKRQADHFVESILHDKASLSECADSIKDIAVGEAWYLSYLKKQVQPIPLG
jgi:predicted dehydrogenase